jgi:hypothetical protein
MQEQECMPYTGGCHVGVWTRGSPVPRTQEVELTVRHAIEALVAKAGQLEGGNTTSSWDGRSENEAGFTTRGAGR